MSDYPGYFHDGKTAARRPVRVRLVPAGIEIEEASGGVVALWRYGDLALVDRDYLNETIRLRNREARWARLVVAEPRLLEDLCAAAPELRAPSMFRAASLKFVAIWAGCLAAFGVVIVHGLPALATGVAGLIPVSWEEEMGGEVAERAVDLLAGGETCSGQTGRVALVRLTERLSQTVETPYNFTVSVADGSMVNAFALPGGHIILLRGLLESAESADEVAGVLAHEMGHVVERHPMEGWVRQAGLASLFGALVGGSEGGSATAATAELMIGSSYGRKAEAEADERAFAMLERANIPAAGFARFFERLAGKEDARPGLARYFSTHPPSEERARAAKAQPTAGRPAMSEADWDALRHICD